jgi:phosphoribosylaminoimidazolecarboxamide formyltransferase/IMP cyclohydrolase
VQERDHHRPVRKDLEVVTERAPTEVEMADLLFAWSVVKHAASNAIVYARDGAARAIGAGRTSRVDAAVQAATKARDVARQAGLDPETMLTDTVVASDAFFPFPDGLEACANAGARAVIQPGGSVKDKDVIDAANARGMAMVFTGTRVFRH